MIGWFYLGGAILFEVAGTTAMKLSEGLTRFWPSVTIFVTYGVSFVLLTFCLKHMDVSLAYAIWAGLGTALIAVIGLLLFKLTGYLWLDPLVACLVALNIIIIHLVGDAPSTFLIGWTADHFGLTWGVALTLVALALAAVLILTAVPHLIRDLARAQPAPVSEDDHPSGPRA